MHGDRDSGPTVTVTYVMDLKVEVGTDLAKLERDIQDLMSGAPVEVREVEIDNLGITEEAKLKPIYKTMTYTVEPITATTVGDIDNLITGQPFETIHWTIETPPQNGRR